MKCSIEHYSNTDLFVGTTIDLRNVTYTKETLKNYLLDLKDSLCELNILVKRVLSSEEIDIECLNVINKLFHNVTIDITNNNNNN